jgi:hypothetical protein
VSVNGILRCDLIGLLIEDIVDQIVDILIVIVKGVAVDAAGLHKILYGNLGKRLLFQQLKKSRYNFTLCKVRHFVTLPLRSAADTRL